MVVWHSHNFNNTMESLDMKLLTLLVFVLALIFAASAGGRYSVASAQKGPGIESKFKQIIQSRRQSYAQQVPQQVLSKQVFQSQQHEEVQTAKPIVQQQQLISSIDNQEIVSNQEVHVDAEPAIFGSVAGTAGVDFPAYTRVPNTGFSCDAMPFNPGMYADEATACQAFHICYNGRRDSFLCGVGTVFNQEILNCDYWYSVECSKSSRHYGVNQEFGKSTRTEFQSSVQKSINSVASGVKGAGGSSFREEIVSNIQRPQPVSTTSRRVISSSIVTQKAPPIVVPSKTISQQFQSVRRFESLGGKVLPPKYPVKGGSSDFIWSAASSGQQTSVRPTNNNKDATSTNLVSPARRIKLQPVMPRADKMISMDTEGSDNSSQYSEHVDVKMKMPMNRENNTFPEMNVVAVESDSAGRPMTNQSDQDQWRPINRNRVASAEPAISTPSSITTTTQAGPETTIKVYMGPEPMTATTTTMVIASSLDADKNSERETKIASGRAATTTDELAMAATTTTTAARTTTTGTTTDVESSSSPVTTSTSAGTQPEAETS